MFSMFAILNSFLIFFNSFTNLEIFNLSEAKINLTNFKNVNVFAPYFSRTISRIHEIISDKYWNENIKKI